MWKTMIKKVEKIQKSSHTSTSLKYDVFGSDVATCRRDEIRVQVLILMKKKKNVPLPLGE